MFNTNRLLLSSLTSLTLGTATLSAAEATTPPRGPAVGELAGSCPIGPFGQTSKAGPYNALCDVMSDSEKCLAFIKRSFNNDGSHEVSSHPEKLRFCLETLESELIGE